MSLTRTDVVKIAHLARLELTEAELLLYQDQLSAILDYAERLNELDLADVLPTAHAISQQNVLREDKAEPSLPLADVLYNAPKQAANQFVVQAVLDDGHEADN
ncbi:MAG: Asp-tRNA(Asn)/Glu-tRNA(Gln) amidotransferase subunit GatC [Chloroflexi bacterium]|nr:Asp-tRNA(Asn)/Glu-tRNA(Gln) amidotransferase subunit GatC [Chloroflexota bacterium]